MTIALIRKGNENTNRYKAEMQRHRVKMDIYRPRREEEPNLMIP